MGTKGSRKRASFRVTVDDERCKGCLLCVYACRKIGAGALKESEKKTTLGGPLPTAKDKCTGCRWCERYCPDFSIAVEEAEGC